MRIFVTGATGFIGSAIVRELQGAGHQVLGLARSDEGAGLLRAMGAEPHRGDVRDLDSLRRGAVRADGVIHAAFIHDFSRFVENCEIDRQAIEALGAALAGRDAHLVVTSGTAVAGLMPGHLVTEEDESAPIAEIPRAASEEAAAAVAARGVSTSILRLPPSVHSPDRQGLVTCSSPARVRPVSRPMWAMGSTAGLPCTGSTRHVSSGWRWRRALPGPVITPSTRRGCR